ATGIDDDCHCVVRRRLPRRPDPEPSHANRPVELAPSLLPAGLDVGDLRPARRLPVGIRRELELAAVLALLEAVRVPLEPLGARPLRARERDADRHALQRNALFSLSKKPSCCAYVSSVESRSNSSSRRRCSCVTWCGITTLTRMRWSPRPKPWSTGIPRRESTRTSPGCVPGPSSSSNGPSSVSIVTVVPSAAWTTLRSTVEKMSFPSRTKRGSGFTWTRT